ncbi:phosphonopyruvate decarboxylase protein [Halorhabdus tiamatea SARL4B]|uniref:Multi antimicrobial extrusion protein (Na(+)/drug antiporter), MATE family of MDR efflux pumps n=1 Tax=Halorhabdus tiamatea SARL4B TaxID=1033806 RepID=F7PF38_9EURY|nr:MATE family efflux transporter [Halorhabdus tiamatea]ERJ06026.1 phosphonopyruvate decarboxylase protein [Halorhabdus tiamatea SARL4B]CCQ34412.1 multi antimicrobial extrusion protein (Na(+)/drug antiporter), MATE family of MDR efflux pumps [Halorhabdus tiamatea SARL4B]
MTQTTDDRSDRFTDGSILWPLLALAGPLTVSQLLQVAYNLTDTFWVGRLGADAVSALAFAWPLILLLISVGGGMTNAGTILVSQHVGAGNDDRIGSVAGQTLAFVGVLSIAIAAVGALAVPYALDIIGTTPGTAIHAQAVAYARIVILGNPFTVGFFVFMALLRGWGDTKTPMYLMGFSVVLNILLDPVLVLGFVENPLFEWLGAGSVQETLYSITGFAGHGVTGAAVATVFSRAVAAAIGLWLLFGGRVGLQLSIDDLRLHVETVGKIVRLGVPGAIDQSTQSVAAIVMTALIATVGTDAVAAYGIGNRFVSLVWLPTVAMGMSVETVVGQNLGAGHRDRARRTVYVAIAILAAAFLLVGAVTFVYARPIVGLFITGPDAATIVDHGATFLRVVTPTWLAMASYHMMNGAFYGSGSTRLAMGVGVTTLWGARAAFAALFVLVLSLGAIGAWSAIALSNVTAAIVAAIVFFRGDWLADVISDAGGRKEPDQP